MSDLSNTEKRKFERLLEMGSGYVLNFSNRTFEEFILDSTGRSIYDARYEYGSGSKANRLRAFWNATNSLADPVQNPYSAPKDGLYVIQSKAMARRHGFEPR
jgi:hypothetical protein